MAEVALAGFAGGLGGGAVAEAGVEVDDAPAVAGVGEEEAVEMLVGGGGFAEGLGFEGGEEDLF
ncbi:MAG: hypothetical protein HC860_19870 [Alkalinema sp. RU_4_3]|nr:hypothetical protein [Alkalinema sp. RU_4_3]